MGIILDSGFLYSLKIKQDQRHSAALKIFKEIDWKSYGSIITTDLVVGEVYTLTNVRTRCNPNSIEKIVQLIWGSENFFTIYWLNLDDYKEIVNILKKYSNSDKLLSFVDASLIYLSHKFEFFNIVTFDSHFDGLLTRITS
jgi:predicted nucleic acid-binding protein